MLTVRALSRAAQTTPDTIRHYARIGLLKPSRNPDNGYRLFRHDDIERVRFICRAKRLGFTLREIEALFDHADAGRSPCPAVRDMIRKRIRDNRERLTELNRLQHRMEKALKQWETMPDGLPGKGVICHLIESITTGEQR